MSDKVFQSWSDAFAPTNNVSIVDEEAEQAKSESEEVNTMIAASKIERCLFYGIADAKGFVLPAPGECVTIMTNKSISQVAFLDNIRKDHGIDEIVTFVYSVAPASAVILHDIVTNHANKAIIVYSTFHATAHKEKHSTFNKLFFGQSNDKMIVKTAWTHAKMTAIKTKDGNYYILNGSGNFAANARIENYCVINSKDTYEQVKQFALSL